VRSKLVTCLLQPKGTDGESAGGVFEPDLIYIRITVSPYHRITMSIMCSAQPNYMGRNESQEQGPFGGVLDDIRAPYLSRPNSHASKHGGYKKAACAKVI
jgi:hypothetical protein